MTTTDASSLAVISTNTKRRKSFYTEEEDIIIKPSTELIPDEYEHEANEGVLFHIFRTATVPEKDLAEELLACAKSIDYKVNAENHIHHLNKLDEVKADLEAIKKESVNRNALVLVFIGYSGKKEGTLLMLEEDETFQSAPIIDIWNIFSSNNCEELKYKPKIFIFCTSKLPVSEVQVDSIRHRTMDFQKVYDFPAESDMLIVYQKEDEAYARNKIKFINQLCSNIKNYSKKYDIIDLVSHIHEENHKPIPLIISTLTRKFYLTPSNEREHLLSVIENHYYLEEALQKIQEEIKKLHEAQKKKKEKKFSFSFKRKTEEKPKIVDRKRQPVQEETKVSKTEKSPSVGARPSSTGSATGLEKQSRKRSEADGASLPGPNRASTSSTAGLAPGRRSRNPSETDGATQKKPMWKF